MHIYIYIYVCVCVCVCVFGLTRYDPHPTARVCVIHHTILTVAISSQQSPDIAVHGCYPGAGC